MPLLIKEGSPYGVSWLIQYSFGGGRQLVKGLEVLVT